MIESILHIFFFWFISWVFLTLMDRVDEHNLIIWKFQTPLAYTFGILTAVSFVFSIDYFNFLYPLIVGMCIEWIIKNKLEYPSHVFFLFVLALYFGYRHDLLPQYVWYTGLYLGISFLISNYIKSRTDKNSKFYRYFYTSYLSKLSSDIFLWIILKEPLLIVFGLSFAYSCLLTKKYLPGRNP
ncbi:MAG: hypothetical protein ACD_71C00190G0002 [uncultured bacterium (gcode 4)]|uniref:Uncharacterized protein n=1 Tax=uncultured bacterium (gcode 4) TaxID=1234023 RepID=K1ZIL1_9BACT|nr:MAG: hypothetical protein ACD_71C00190G0002 [uncultured bacterium (gcode 4)]